MSLGRTIQSSLICLRDIARHGIPDELVFVNAGMGDDLQATCLIRNLQLQKPRKIWMMTDWPALFDHNPDIHFAPTIRPKLRDALKALGTQVRRPTYRAIHTSTPVLPDEPVMVQQLRSAGFRGRALLRPYLHLSRDEQAHRPSGDYIVMQSSGLSARFPLTTKEWFPDRFAAVASVLGRSFTVIQLGSKTDPRLPAAQDLRGATSLRQSASIIAGARLVVCLEGFLVHLARAVNRRAVVVLGGRTLWYHFGYPSNVHVAGDVPCKGCFLMAGCPNDMDCMKRIEAPDVLRSIDQALALPADTLDTFAPTIGEGVLKPGEFMNAIVQDPVDRSS